MINDEDPKDIEPGWKGLSILFFWYRWKWVHALLRHDMLPDPQGATVCSCGMRWE